MASELQRVVYNNCNFIVYVFKILNRGGSLKDTLNEYVRLKNVNV